MKVTKDEKGNVALIAVMLVVGLVIGFAVGRVMNNNQKGEVMSKTSSAVTSATKAADLRSTLVLLGVEHMTLTASAVDQTLDGSAGAGETAKALYANGTDIGAAVGSVYGKDAEATFNTVWKLHLDQFVAYAVADSKGDAAGKTAALTSIDTNYTKPLSAYLAKANPNLPEKTLYSLLADHVTQTAGVIDDHVAKDYAKENADLTAANKHIEGIFSALAGGIVAQFPDKFQG
jgi:type II secretory pathway pseudopilin PulG